MIAIFCGMTIILAAVYVVYQGRFNEGVQPMIEFLMSRPLEVYFKIKALMDFGVLLLLWGLFSVLAVWRLK